MDMDSVVDIILHHIVLNSLLCYRLARESFFPTKKQLYLQFNNLDMHLDGNYFILMNEKNPAYMYLLHFLLLTEVSPGNCSGQQKVSTYHVFKSNPTLGYQDKTAFLFFQYLLFSS